MSSERKNEVLAYLQETWPNLGDPEVIFLQGFVRFTFPNQGEFRGLTKFVVDFDTVFGGTVEIVTQSSQKVELVVDVPLGAPPPFADRAPEGPEPAPGCAAAPTLSARVSRQWMWAWAWGLPLMYLLMLCEKHFNCFSALGRRF